MITKTITLYSFDELSDEAKEKAIEQVRETEADDFNPFYIEEAHSTLKEFCKIFNVDYDYIDYMETYRNKYHFNYEDDILSLSSVRLSKYLWNNYREYIYKHKWYNSFQTNTKIKHKRIVSKYSDHCKKWYNSYYSAITIEKENCPLTGICYDNDMLDPVWKAIDRPNNRITFENVLIDCIESLCIAVQRDHEYRLSEKAIIETIKANEYTFTENGTLEN